MDQLDQLEASELEYNSSNNSYSDNESDSSLGANISPPQSRSPSPVTVLARMSRAYGLDGKLGRRTRY